MKAQTQKYTDVGGEVPGDCWRTAVACLIDMERDEVPHFIHLYPDTDYDWFFKTVEFVEQNTESSLGCYNPTFPVYVDPEANPKYAILTGQSPRGNWQHCVIVDAVTGEMAHDPHPSGAGVTSRSELFALIPKPEVIHVSAN